MVVATKELRPNLREEDPRETARRRSAEILGNGLNFEEDGVDEFACPMAPDGWTYEWKRFSNVNMEDRTHQNHVKRTGWQAVPVSRHPEMMESGATGAIIRRGMILMERPEEITNMVKDREYRKARAETRKENALVSDEGFLGRKDAQVRQTRTRSYEPLIIPDK